MTPDRPNYRWTICGDRRTVDVQALRQEILELQASLAGLDVTLDSDETIEAAADSGTYRDFVPIAHACAEHLMVLEAMAEELLIEFGFEVDFVKHA